MLINEELLESASGWHRGCYFGRALVSFPALSISVLYFSLTSTTYTHLYIPTMKTSFVAAALSAAHFVSSTRLPPVAAPAARILASSVPTQVPVPHRITVGNLNAKELSQPLQARQSTQQIPFQFCPEFFGRSPKLCSQCGGDSRIPGTCDQVLVSGPQSNCPPGGPYGGCAGYYCQCTTDGTDNSPKVTSTTVISGATGTVIWEPMTLTQYASLRSKTTVTLTEIATATSADDDELETVVAAVFAGGVAWWVACKSIIHSKRLQF